GLVEELGIDTFPTWLPENMSSIYEGGDGKLQQFAGDYPVTDAVMGVAGMLELSVLGAKAHLGRPWNAVNAKQYDGMSAEDWAQRYVPDPFVAELLAIAVRSAFSVEPKNISFLHLLHYAATCGSFGAFENVRGGGDAVRFRKGTQD